MGLGLLGDNTGQGGFTAPRGTPEDHGKDVVRFNSGPDKFTLTQKMLLSHEGLQVIRPDAFRKGLTSGPGLACIIFEKIHTFQLIAHR